MATMLAISVLPSIARAPRAAPMDNCPTFPENALDGYLLKKKKPSAEKSRQAYRKTMLGVGPVMRIPMRSATDIIETPPAMVPFSGSSMLVVFEVTEMATGILSG